MLERFDQQLFLFINSANSPLFDQVMNTISGKLIWVPLYVAILVFLGVKYKRKFLVILVFIIIAATLADQSSVIVKNIFHRLRPCHETSILAIVHLVNGECGGIYGFVSSHATNSFDVALLSLSFIKKRWYSISIIFWAGIISYSRVYLGVHYPGDVIFGALLGSFIGWGIYNLYVLTDINLLKDKPYFNLPQKNSPPH
jgi:undecaprenyl-diphosphatase